MVHGLTFHLCGCVVVCTRPAFLTQWSNFDDTLTMHRDVVFVSVSFSNDDVVHVIVFIQLLLRCLCALRCLLCCYQQWLSGHWKDVCAAGDGAEVFCMLQTRSTSNRSGGGSEANRLVR